MTESPHLIPADKCTVPNCGQTFQNPPAEYFVYTPVFPDTPYAQPPGICLVPRSELEQRLASMEHVTRVSGTDHSSRSVYYNESDYASLSPQHKSGLMKLHFCRFHAPSLATAADQPEVVKLDRFGQTSVISDELRRRITRWAERNKEAKRNFDAAPSDQKSALSAAFQPLDLSYTVVPSSLDLSGLDTAIDGHSQNLLLKGCYFEGETNFSKTSVDHIVLNGSRFRGKVDFWQFRGRVGAEFKGCNFEDRATFRGAIFDGNPIVFDKSNFKGWTDFEGTEFGNQTSFIKCRFQEQCRFDESTFRYQAQFFGAQFESVTFHRVTFRDSAFFNTRSENVTKFKSASFRGARFDRGGCFDGAQFGEVDFLDAVIDGSFHFRNVTVSGKAFFDYTGGPEDYFGHYYDDKYKDWPKGESFKWISFEDTSFKGVASFQNRVFRHTCSFRNACFEKAPRFEGATLHANTDFHNTKFKDRSSDYAVRSYRYLKGQMSQLGAKTEETLFFGLEQHATLNLYGSRPALFSILHKSRRETAAPDFLHLLLLIFYKWAADFGRSPVRLLMWMVIALIAAAVYYNLAFEPAASLAQSVLWSMRTIVKPFSTFPPDNLWLGLFVFCYSIFQFTLLIMLGFAIRRRMGIR